jgi:hypothetical protein
MNTITFVIAFIFAANKRAFYDFGVQRRKAAKIFACFLSGQIWAKNMTRATALVPPNPAQGTPTFSFNANKRSDQHTFYKQQNRRGRIFL